MGMKEWQIGAPQRLDHGLCSNETAASSPTLPLPRAPAALPTRRASPRMDLTPRPSYCRRCLTRAMFVLTGRAPNVP
jgi:hypothetical protein